MNVWKVGYPTTIHINGWLSDVLHLADDKCSGQEECSLFMPDVDFEAVNPCHKALDAYLQASYTCVKGDHDNLIVMLRISTNTNQKLLFNV